MLALRREIRLGMIGYMNAAPYRMVNPPFPAAQVVGNPERLAASVAQGETDCCLLPVAARLRTPSWGDLSPGFGIAARGQVLSVLAFCQRPLRELVEEQREIFVTGASVTSRQLLESLCVMAYGLAPHLSPSRESSEAVVLIGDQALDFARSERRWPFSIDLSQWWYELTGLPFVFAEWVINPGVSESDAAEVAQWLDATLSASETPSGRRQLVDAAKRVGWSEQLADLYYSLLQFRLGDEHRRGRDHFLSIIGTDHEVKQNQ